MYLFQLLLLLLLKMGGTAPVKENPATVPINISKINPIIILYNDLKLNGRLNYDAFEKAYNGINIYHPARKFLAIADFTMTSDIKRLFIIDIENRKLVLNTWVAHGKNSGMNIVTTYSNIPESFMSSPGFYMVNDIIISPKHGKSLLLEGLEKGINDNARKREIIIHGAEYVCETFIKNTGRIGRSYGCPAVPVKEMTEISTYLAGGSLLYIYKGI